jgi:hypothetical protein
VALFRGFDSVQVEHCIVLVTLQEDPKLNVVLIGKLLKTSWNGKFAWTPVISAAQRSSCYCQTKGGAGREGLANESIRIAGHHYFVLLVPVNSKI